MGWTRAEYERPVSLRQRRSWMPARKSRASRIIGERAVRSMAASTSASTEASVPSTIWRTMGSGWTPAHRRGAGRRDGARLRPDRGGGGRAGQDQVAERIDVDMLAREHDGRRAELLHDRGPGEAIARPEPGAIVHGALDVAASEAHGPRARPGALGAAVAGGHGPRGRTSGHADADDPQVDPLDSLAGPARARTFGAVAVAVALLVGGVEALHGLGGARGVDRAGRQLHGHLPRLTEVAEIGEAEQAPRRLRHALARQRVDGLGLEPREVAVDEVEIEPRVTLHRGLDVVVLEVDGEEPEGGHRPGRRRDHGGPETQELDQPARLERAGAAERHQRVVARIEAALDAHLLDGVGLVPRGDLEHALGRPLGGETELAGEALDALPGQIDARAAPRPREDAAGCARARAGRR